MKKSNNNLIKVVSLLQDGRYHDGTSIGSMLQMTRTAVWKTVKKLQRYNVRINSAKGKGYVLQEPLILLDKNRIEAHLTHSAAQLVIFEQIDSTNEYLKRIKKTKELVICLAEQQLRGKGRLNRTWHSPFGKNIYLSFLYPMQKDISELAGLSLVTSLAVVRTLNSFVDKNHFSVKWPNDILYENKKIAGNLIEITAESHGVSQVIIGVGININMLHDDNCINQSWTSLQLILGEYIDRNNLCVRIINQLLSYLDEFVLQGFKSFQREWMKADCLMNKTITLQHVRDTIQGKVLGINEQGHLLLEMQEGIVRAFSSGDTSYAR